MPLHADQTAIGEGAEGGPGALIDQVELLDPSPKSATRIANDGDRLLVLEPAPLARLRPLLERAVRQIAHLRLNLLVGLEDGQQIGTLTIVQVRHLLSVTR